MPLRVRVEAPSLPDEAVEAFRRDVRSSFGIYRALRRQYYLPACHITALLAEDFAGAVSRNLRGAFRVEEGSTFDANRVGGVVAAKNLAQSDDAARVVIVFDASLWTDAAVPQVRAGLIHLVAHEMAHPVIERARYASGAMDGVPRPSLTASDTFRSMARIMAGEYRADRLADFLLAERVSVGAPGEAVPMTHWTLTGEAYIANLKEILERAHPAWPDLVQDYRGWRLPIEQMWSQLVTAIDQTLTMVVHTQASADVAEDASDVLERPDLADLPAVRLYLAEPWSGFLDALRSYPLLTRMGRVAAAEETVTHAGARAILSILNRLGIYPVDHGDGTWGIDVRAPRR